MLSTVNPNLFPGRHQCRPVKYCRFPGIVLIEVILSEKLASEENFVHSEKIAPKSIFKINR